MPRTFSALFQTDTDTDRFTTVDRESLIGWKFFGLFSKIDLCTFRENSNIDFCIAQVRSRILTSCNTDEENMYEKTVGSETSMRM